MRSRWFLASKLPGCLAMDGSTRGNLEAKNHRRDVVIASSEGRVT